MLELEGRTALVTGSSRGIGAQIARVFAARGARVAVHGRDANAVKAVVAQVEQAGGQAVPVLADLTRYEEVEEMRTAVEESLGTVDILVANAGGSNVRPGPVEDISEADWRASLDNNLTSIFFTVKVFLPGMKQRGHGTVITISSAAARRPTAQSPVAYTAAKAGVELLTRQLALQAGPYGVRANCIAPETILTERNQQKIPGEVQEQLRLSHPVQRLGTPEDVAEAAFFLASERSSWVSGITLDVAGASVLA